MRTRLRYVRFFFVSSHKGFRTWIRHVRMYTSFLVPIHFFLENGSLLSRLAVRNGPGSSVRYCRIVRLRHPMLCSSLGLHPPASSSVRYCRIVCLRHPMLCSSLGLRPPASLTGCGGLRLPQFAIVVQYAVASCALWLTGTPPAFIVHRTRRDTSPLAAARLRSHWTRCAPSTQTASRESSEPHAPDSLRSKHFSCQAFSVYCQQNHSQQMAAQGPPLRLLPISVL